MIRPSQLPRVRDRMVTLLTSADSALRGAVAGDRHATEGLDATARHLASGALYWASADMTALAVAAGRELDAVRWTAADRPAPSGLMVMDGGAGWFSTPQGDFPADAVSWGPDPDGLLLTFWAGRDRIDALAGDGARADPERVPPLLPVAGRAFPVSDGHQAVSAIPADYRTLAATVAAAWHLMYQPAVAGRARAEIGRPLRRAYARAGRLQPEVTIIDLRALYQPDDPGREPGTGPGRYSHRWVVRGHWRNQAHGPGRGLRKRIWIPDYVKGPDGAPLLVRERVNVWRR